MNSCQVLLREIKSMRVHLISLYQKSSILSAHEIVIKSQELDKLILEYQKMVYAEKKGLGNYND